MSAPLRDVYLFKHTAHFVSRVPSRSSQTQHPFRGSVIAHCSGEMAEEMEIGREADESGVLLE
jgi:hypothetical protein